jgi:hypothetical protein
VHPWPHTEFSSGFVAFTHPTLQWASSYFPHGVNTNPKSHTGRVHGQQLALRA